MAVIVAVAPSFIVPPPLTLPYDALLAERETVHICCGPISANSATIDIFCVSTAYPVKNIPVIAQAIKIYEQKYNYVLKVTYAIGSRDAVKREDGTMDYSKMRFDAVVGNPPYQAVTGGGSDVAAAAQAKPIFQLFVQQAKEISPHFLSMIIPARWYNGGIGLNDFRSEMLRDKRLVELVDYSNAKELFPTVDIAGGICYFLWQATHNDNCMVVNCLAGNRTELKRSLAQFGDFFIRSNSAISIIDKVTKKATHFVSDMVSAIDTFGIPSKEKGHEVFRNGDVLLLHSVGANSQGVDYIPKTTVTKNAHLIGKYKMLKSKNTSEEQRQVIKNDIHYLAGFYLKQYPKDETLSKLFVWTK